MCIAGSNAQRKALSIDAIHQQILEWDVKDLKSGRLSAKSRRTTNRIPQVFSGLSQYSTWFHGLLMEELRTVVLGSWEELLEHNREATPIVVKHVQRCSNLHNITLLYKPDDEMYGTNTAILTAVLHMLLTHFWNSSYLALQLTTSLFATISDAFIQTTFCC